MNYPHALTLCWSCSKAYGKAAPACPHCGAANGNVAFEAAVRAAIAAPAAVRAPMTASRVAALVAAAYEALDFLDDQADVVDGDYGAPAPNRAMTIASELRAALGEDGNPYATP